MDLEPQRKAHILVLAGDFNPAIFQPHWLASLALIRRGEAENASIEVIHKDVSIFSLEWCKINVTAERLVLETTQEPYFQIARDLVVSIMRALAHTPVRAVGINWDRRYFFQNQEQWNQLGHTLVPKQRWAALDNPGTLKVMVRGKKNPESLGYQDVTLESIQTKENPWGVRIFMNDHHSLKNDAELGHSAEQAVEIIETYWEDSAAQMERVSSNLLRDAS